MQRAILILLSCGVIVSTVSAQPADERGEMQGYGGYGGSPYGGRYGVRMGGFRGMMDPRQTQRLVERWKNSKEAAERDKIETELRGGLQQEFAARLAIHEKEIKQLEVKVRQLRERLALRKEKQDEIVEHRLQQILREAQGLGWGSEGGPGNAMYQYSTTTEAASFPDNPFAPSSDLQPAVEGQPVDDLFGEPTSAGARP